MAETPGFEPGVPHSGYDGLANRWFQPLTHVSSAWLSRAITRASRQINHCFQLPYTLPVSIHRRTDSLRRFDVAGDECWDSTEIQQA